jgi:hypothetical protein
LLQVSVVRVAMVQNVVIATNALSRSLFSLPLNILQITRKNRSLSLSPSYIYSIEKTRQTTVLSKISIMNETNPPHLSVVAVAPKQEHLPSSIDNQVEAIHHDPTPTTTSTTTTATTATTGPLTTPHTAAAEARTNVSIHPNNSNTNSKKRWCRFPGCDRVIKSQGHCQRHGARAKRCRMAGCEKQAQGTHDGMCKRHWKILHCPDPPLASSNGEEEEEEDDDEVPEEGNGPPHQEPDGTTGAVSEAGVSGNYRRCGTTRNGAHSNHNKNTKSARKGGTQQPRPPPPMGESVYDHILPNSITFRPNNHSNNNNHNNNSPPPAMTTTIIQPESISHDNHSSITNTTNIITSSHTAPATDTEPPLSGTDGTCGIPNDGTTIAVDSSTITTTTTLATAAATTTVAFATAATALEVITTIPHPNNNSSSSDNLMPLIQFLQGNAHLPAGWHRQQERRARGVHPITSITTQLEPWERQLVRTNNNTTKYMAPLVFHWGWGRYIYIYIYIHVYVFLF